MKTPKKISLQHEVTDYSKMDSPSPEKSSSDKELPKKTVHPEVFIHHDDIPEGVKPGHKVILHGVIKKVHRATTERKGEEPEVDSHMEVELHHMENHGADASHSAKDEDDIESGLSKAESKQSNH